MPGVHRFSVDLLVDECKRVFDLGVPGVILFGIPDAKDARGSGADAADAAFLVAPDGPARRTLAADDPLGNEAIGRFPDAYRCAPAALDRTAPDLGLPHRPSFAAFLCGTGR